MLHEERELLVDRDAHDRLPALIGLREQGVERARVVAGARDVEAELGRRGPVLLAVGGTGRDADLIADSGGKLTEASSVGEAERDSLVAGRFLKL